jgi:hypothetical protein
MSAVYDAGLLIAADRNNRDIWADHRARLELGIVPRTTAPVVGQVSRSRRQVQLHRLLRGCDIVSFAPEQAHEVGELLGRSGTTDVVDAHVVLIASRMGAAVYTSDVEDIEQLSYRLPQPIVIRRVGPSRRRSHR